MTTKKTTMTTSQPSSLTPPPIVFQIIWPILYVSMIISVVVFIYHYKLQYRSRAKWWVSAGFLLFVVQLIVNLYWPYLYSHEHEDCSSFRLILILDVLVAMTIVSFWRVSRLAAIIMTPYLMWIVFASYLNGVVCLRMNDHSV